MSVLNIKDMPRKDWLKLRKTGIGGSDAGAICGVNPYKSALSVYLDKTTEDMDDNDSEAMRQGRDLEEYVALRFTDHTGIKVRKTNLFYRSDMHPFMTANPDRLLTGERSGLECKVCSAYQADKWKDGKIPESYEIQCRHYMAVMNWDYMYIACLIMGKEFIIRKIERDKELEEAVIKIESNFWNENVLKRSMPDPDGSKAYDEVLDKYFHKSGNKNASPLIGFDKELKRRDDINVLIDKLETERSEIDQRIKLYLRDNEAASNDRYKVSWIFTETNRLDTGKLKTEEPDIYNRYLKVSEGRRFSIKRVA